MGRRTYDEAATCKDYLQVRREGSREVRRSVKHYNLEAILAVDFRVRSGRGAQFRRWANQRLHEYPYVSGEVSARQPQGLLIKADLRAFSLLGNTLDCGCIPLSKRHTLLCSV